MSEACVNIEIFDTTLRDGAQALPEAHQFRDSDRIPVAHHIATLGTNVIEAGFPATTGDSEAVRAIAQTVGNISYAVETWESGKRVGDDLVHATPVIAGLARCVPDDIETTWGALEFAQRPRIHTFISTDAEHMAAKFPDKSPDEVLKMGRYAVDLAKTMSYGHPGATVEFSAEAATTTDEDYLERVIRDMVGEGADVINVPDTVGQRHASWMNKFYGRVISWALSENPDVIVSAHNHNDIGHAAANSYALVEAAAAYADERQQEVNIQIESTICGLGERAGNADMFSVVGGLFKFTPELEVPVRWSFNPVLSVQAATFVMEKARMKVPRQTPIVGEDVNRHRSGIHSDGVLKGGHRLYMPYDPQFWGHKQQAVHEDGRYQGRAGRIAARSRN